jgi:two-component sensor histidine kinase
VSFAGGREAILGPIDFERLFDALPSPYMLLDREFRYVAVNRAYEDVVMRGRADLMGQVLFDLFPNPGESGKRLRDSFERVFDTGRPDTLAFIPYDIPRPPERGGGMEQRFWTAVHTPLPGADGEVAYLIQNTTDVTDIVRLRQAAAMPFSVKSGEARLLERAREAEHQHQQTMSESEDFRRIFQQAPGFIAVLHGPEHVFAFANDAYSRLVGGRTVIGLPVAEALPEVVEQGFVQMLDGVYSTGKSAGGEAMRVVLQHAPDEAPQETFLDFSYDAIRNRDGEITGVFVQGMDRTEAVRAQHRQRLLLDELNHRVKNTLATVQSIAAQTFRNSGDMNAAKRDFEARIIALSNAHNLLSRTEWASATMAEVIGLEMRPHDPARVSMEGPAIVLSPKASIAVTLFIHELSTNAAKHGSLSVPGGHVAIGWKRAKDGASLDIAWTETGGPPAKAPQRRGFGTRLIDSIVRGELGGAMENDYREEGLRSRIALPLETIEAD